MLPYEDAVKIWASEREGKGRLPSAIKAVEFETVFDGCDTCGYGRGTTVCLTFDNRERAEFALRDIGVAIQEVLEVAARD